MPRFHGRRIYKLRACKRWRILASFSSARANIARKFDGPDDLRGCLSTVLLLVLLLVADNESGGEQGGEATCVELGHDLRSSLR